MHQHYITMFLAEADDKLDVGFSLPLQKIALARGNEHEQREFMLSDEVQNLLEDAATAQFSHSLSAERMAATVKKREGRHIALLGNVSRDLLCRKFNIWRENKCQLLEEAAQRLKKAKRSSWNAMAWELDYNNAPLGHQYTHATAPKPRVIAATGNTEPASGGSEPASGGSCQGARSEPAGGCSHPVSTPIKRRSEVSLYNTRSGKKLHPPQEAARQVSDNPEIYGVRKQKICMEPRFLEKSNAYMFNRKMCKHIVYYIILTHVYKFK